MCVCVCVCVDGGEGWGIMKDHVKCNCLTSQGTFGFSSRTFVMVSHHFKEIYMMTYHNIYFLKVLSQDVTTCLKDETGWKAIT